MGERGGRRRVGQVVGGHVDRLHRGDRTVLGRRDALLQLTHLGGQRGLVTGGGRHAAEKRRDLRARLGEAEDVVHEEEHVLALITEVLGGGEAGQAHTQARSGRLVHLTVDQHGLVDDARLAHLKEEVGALAGALPHAGEYRGTTVREGQVVDELHDDDGLAYAGAAEQARLAALDVGLEQVDDLDAGLEDLGLGLEVLVLRCGAVNRVVVLHDRHLAAVDDLAHHVPDTTQRARADRHLNGSAGIDDLEATLEAVGRRHSHGANLVTRKVRLHLRDGDHAADRSLDVDLERVVNGRDPVRRELDVHDRSDHSDDASYVHRCVLFVRCHLFLHGR